MRILALVAVPNNSDPREKSTASSLAEGSLTLDQSKNTSPAFSANACMALRPISICVAPDESQRAIPRPTSARLRIQMKTNCYAR